MKKKHGRFKKILIVIVLIVFCLFGIVKTILKKYHYSTIGTVTEISNIPRAFGEIEKRIHYRFLAYGKQYKDYHDLSIDYTDIEIGDHCFINYLPQLPNLSYLKPNIIIRGSKVYTSSGRYLGDTTNLNEIEAKANDVRPFY